MNEINKSPDLEMVVLQEISSAIVNERNGTALLRHILDVLYRRSKEESRAGFPHIRPLLERHDHE